MQEKQCITESYEKVFQCALDCTRPNPKSHLTCWADASLAWATLSHSNHRGINGVKTSTHYLVCGYGHAADVTREQRNKQVEHNSNESSSLSSSIFFSFTFEVGRRSERREREREGGRSSGLRLRRPSSPLALVFILPLWPLTFQPASYKKNRAQPEMAGDIQQGWSWSNMLGSSQWKGKECFSEWHKMQQGEGQLRQHVQRKVGHNCSVRCGEYKCARGWII